MTSILHRMKSPEGRLSQQGYVLGFVLPFAAITGLSWASLTGVLGATSSIMMQVCALGWTFLLGFGDAMNIRRYHDLGNSGRLYRLGRPGIVVVPLLAFALNFLIPAQMASAGDMAALSYLINQQFAPSIAPVPMALLGLTFFGVTANLIYLSLMPGQAGPNDYGPDPRGGSIAVPGMTRTDARETDTDDDPVKRALAAYQQQRTAQPGSAALASPAMRMTPSATFGKKRA